MSEGSFDLPPAGSDSLPTVMKLRLLIGDNIPDFRTVLDLEVKS